MAKKVVLVGALDTKGRDFAYVRDLLRGMGFDTIVVDFGVVGAPFFEPDIKRDEVAKSGGVSIEELQSKKDKALAMEVMTRGLKEVVKKLYDEGKLDGIMGMGGSAGTVIATTAMQTLPIGIPKIMVSTVAGGDVSRYVGLKDIIMIPSIVDVAGLNRISRIVYRNAVGALAGMLSHGASEEMAKAPEKPVIVISMFGNTTPCVEKVKELLGDSYEILVFHATGTGGKTMEMLIEEGLVSAVADITTTELADEIGGGVLTAGKDRLFAAARRGVPTVLVPGCVDMINFWAKDTLPESYKTRNIYEWNPNVTLVRTNVEENKKIGEWIAKAANESKGPVAILIPLKGVSMLDSPGGPFWDPEADRACFEAIKSNLKPHIPVYELDYNINDPEFAQKVVEVLLELMKKGGVI
ncbi:MAG: Tm-1-like ATP-binding domain-containing protein [Synergistetes bacterium]|nr:MAG: hypothetical protein XD52_0255 [bacterium 42_11]MBC7332278.1 Tm-1-like ATP-binding domain-containing protein [Synergistota bacterium]MDK2872063.1 hypothetical protein [bacterium]